MSSQTSLTTRRQFLGRSAWGFGSAFILPSLLQGCTDHLIPDPGPGTPIVIPPLSITADDIHSGVKITILTGLKLIPGYGGLVSSLVSMLWPASGDKPWDTIKNQVEAFVDQKIAAEVYQDVSNKLSELYSDLGKIQDALNPPKNTDGTTPAIDYESVRGHWIDTDTDMGKAIISFQSNGSAGDFRLVLLPLFAQFANLYLAFYRDMVLHGKSWGFMDSDVLIAYTTLTKGITDFTNYTKDTWFTDHVAALAKKTPTDYITNEPFNTTNQFNRQMTITALDYTDAWPYFDPITYPNGLNQPDGTPIDVFTREIYSDPFGNTFVEGFYEAPRPIKLPTPATKRPTSITVWGGDRIDAVQLTYPAGGGPGGVTQTDRMGDQDGRASNQPPHGDVFSLDPDWNPFIEVSVTWDWATRQGGSVDKMLAINTMFFIYNNDIVTHQLGKNKGQYDSGVLFYPGRALSSIYIQGSVDITNNSANCIIFGFLFWQSPKATLQAIGRLYVTSPREYSAAELALISPKLGLSANSITDELRAARKAYWEALRARVK